MESSTENRLSPLVCMGVLTIALFVFFYKALFEASGLSAWDFVNAYIVSGKHVLIVCLVSAFILYYQRDIGSVIFAAAALLTTTLTYSSGAIYQYQHESLMFEFLASWHWLAIVKTLLMMACVLLGLKVVLNPSR